MIGPSFILFILIFYNIKLQSYLRPKFILKKTRDYKDTKLDLINIVINILKDQV